LELNFSRLVVEVQLAAFIERFYVQRERFNNTKQSGLFGLGLELVPLFE